MGCMAVLKGARALLTIAALGALLFPTDAAAKHSVKQQTKPPSKPAPYKAPKWAKHSGKKNECPGCARDSKGHIVKPPSAKDDFRQSNPCPSTGKTSGGCPGYEVAHKTPLSQGGLDAAVNLQWLSKDELKANPQESVKK